MKLSEINKKEIRPESGTLKLSELNKDQIKIIETEKEPGYLSRVGSRFSEIGQELTTSLSKQGEAYKTEAKKGNVFKASGQLLRGGLRAAGAVTEGAFVPIAEAPIVKPVTEKVGEVVSGIPGVEDLITKVTDLSERFPEQSKDIQNIIDIASLGGGRAIQKPLASQTKRIGSELAEGAQAFLAPSEEAIQKNIIDLFNRSIKPSTKSIEKGARYENDVLNALRTIKTNADRLNIEDIDGEIVSRTPQSIQELSQAVDQTKSVVFNQYDDLAKRAGQGGATIDAKPIAAEVLKVADNKALQITNPEVIKYAEDWAQRLQGLDVLDTETTQAVIQNLNTSLKSFYRNPSYESASRATIDAAIANNFRKVLDEAIQSATGEQYQILKRQYSALKSIEDDVVRATARDARKNVKGLLDYSDIFTSGQIVGGILSLNPAMFTKGAIERGIKEYISFLNDPNRAVKNIFDDLDYLDTTAKTTTQ